MKVEHEPGPLLQTALQEFSADFAYANYANGTRILAAQRAVKQAPRDRGDQFESVSAVVRMLCAMASGTLCGINSRL